MTDKEKRELKDGVISIFKRFNILDHTATIGGLRDDILRYINSLQEEPVSEDLEEAASNYAEEHRIALMDYETGEIEMNKSLDVVNAFKAGAKWQEEKDDEEKVLTYKHGFEDCKEMMMAKAIDATCFGFQGVALFSFRLPASNYLVGSVVKVIVIKED